LRRVNRAQNRGREVCNTVGLGRRSGGRTHGADRNHAETGWKKKLKESKKGCKDSYQRARSERENHGKIWFGSYVVSKIKQKRLKPGNSIAEFNEA